MNGSNLCQQVPQHIALAIFFNLSLPLSLQKKERINFSAVTYGHSLSLYNSFVVTLFKSSFEKIQHLENICTMLIQNKNISVAIA